MATLCCKRWLCIHPVYVVERQWLYSHHFIVGRDGVVARLTTALQSCKNLLPPSLSFFFFFFLVNKIYCFDDEFLITWIFLWHVIDKGSTVVCVRHGEDNCAMFTRVAKLLDMTWYSIKKAEGSDTITDQTLRIDLISFSSNEWFDKNVKPNQGLIQYFSLKRKYTYHYHLWHIASSKYHFIIKKSLFVSCWH